MNRRHIGILLALMGLAVSQLASAQSSRSMRRVGVLAYSNPVAGHAYLAVLTDELAKLGWIEGRNLQLVYRFANGDATRLSALAAELVAVEPDVLYSSNVQGSVELARATTRIPVVMTAGNDPVAMGLVKSLANPGGNVTGTSSGVGPEIQGKRLGILRELVPRLSRLAVIYNPAEASDAVGLPVLQDYANRLGLKVELLPAGNQSELRSAMDALSQLRVDAVYVFNNAPTYTNREMVCAEALRLRLPTFTLFPQFTDSGCLASYSYSVDDLVRESARFINQILRGASPAVLPVRQPTGFRLVLNARTAASIGLAIPNKVRLAADQVIE